MSRRVTIKDVAAQARVSYQTVSKVLNHQVKVTRETEERIREAVRITGYRPNLAARSLRSKRTHLIGFSWAPAPLEQGNPIIDQFLRSMVQAGQKAGYHILTFPYQPGEKWIDAYRDLIDTNLVDGFILSNVEYDDPRVKFLKDRDFPFVAFGRSNPDWIFPYVDVDGAAGMASVVDHLVQRGHSRIAALAWAEDSRVGNNRMDGFRAALTSMGIQVPPGWILRGEGVYRFGREAAGRLISLPQGSRPTAIVAFNDFMAIGAMHAAQARGLQVGKHIAVTGFDDTPAAKYTTPSLTSVSQPIWEIGRQVIDMLVGFLDGREGLEKNILLEPRLVVRDSTGQDTDAVGKDG